MDEILTRYAEEAAVLAKFPETVVESTWRGLLASFAYEIAAYSEKDEVPA